MFLMSSCIYVPKNEILSYEKISNLKIEKMGIFNYAIHCPTFK